MGMYGVIAFRWNKEIGRGYEVEEEYRRPWRPISQIEHALPSAFKKSYNALLDVVLRVGPGALYKDMPDIIKRYPTECYLFAFGINTFILENLFMQSGVVSWAIPIFLVPQIGLLSLLYGRTLVELSIATNEYFIQKSLENPEEAQIVNHVSRFLPEEGGHIYRYILGNIRNRWGRFHKVLSLGNIAYLLSAFTSGHFTIGALRLAFFIPIAFFLWYKRKQNTVLERDLRRLDRWAASSEGGENRRAAQEAIISYVERTANPYNNWLAEQIVQKNIEPFYRLSLKGLRLQTLPGIVSRLTSLRELDLSNNKFTKIPSWLEQNLVYLERVDIRGNPIPSLDHCNGLHYVTNMPLSNFFCEEHLRVAALKERRWWQREEERWREEKLREEIEKDRKEEADFVLI